MGNPISEMIDIFIDYLEKIKVDFEADVSIDNVSVKVCAVPQMLDQIRKMISPNILAPHREYFDGINVFYSSCSDAEFLGENLQDAYDALILLIQKCLELQNSIKNGGRKCPCCGNQVEYLPVNADDLECKEYCGSLKADRPETFNPEKYSCPNCGSTDSDRLIISFLKKIKLSEASENTRLLQISPKNIIDEWIRIWCPNVDRDSVGLGMDNAELQNLNEIDSGKYDVIICSHVLEFLRDDKKALAELRRILNDDGEIVLLVPVDLNISETDEGMDRQSDHCRVYSKEGLISKLQEYFCIHRLGKDYFGDEVFDACGLTDTGTLYVLTKKEEVNLYKGWIPAVDKNLCENGPLVSVILPAYNHEKYVARAIESVINQSYKNIEILVADDGSSDRTPEVMKQYSKYFAKEYYFEENIRGRAVFLANQASGKYIALIHSDDYWEPDKIALQVKELEEKGGISLTWAYYITEEGETIENATFIKRNRGRIDWLRYLWDKGNCFCNPSSVMLKELFLRPRTHGESAKQLPYYFKWIDFLKDNDIHIVPFPLTKMGVHYSGNNVNDSAPTRENRYREMLEDGIHWMSVLDDMDDSLFISIFGDVFRNKNADSKEELMCEKYFLMLDSGKIGRENAAIGYMALVYPKVKNCLRDKYGYTKSDFVKDEVNKGFISAFLKDN